MAPVLTPEQIEELAEIKQRNRAELETLRSKHTSRNYDGGAWHWQIWCESEGFDDLVNCEYKIIKYVDWITHSATLKDGISPPSYKYAESWINGLQDFYYKQLAQSKIKKSDTERPWGIPDVCTAMKNFDLLEQERISKLPNTALIRVATSEHQAAAMQLSSILSPGLGLFA